ncbi:MAG: molybdopterin-dependent oxidoreductase [Rhizobiaceae bacterium]|nr:molybdopterin-dependent oxidoreductase [Rhizobiaceae bacterium]
MTATLADDAPGGTVLSRRTLLKALGVGLGSFVVPVGNADAAGTAGTFGALIIVHANNRVAVVVGATEMGQGVLSGFAQIVAEELGASWAMMDARPAPADPRFDNPLFGAQLTAGSTSTRGWFMPLRKAAADARERLIAAGAARMGVARAQCEAVSGTIRHRPSGRSVRFGAIAGAAAALPSVANAPLKPQSRWTLLGQPVRRLDLQGKVTGRARFGIDVTMPGLLHAAIRHAPVMGATLMRTPAKPQGAIALVPLDGAFAVVANDTWNANRLADLVEAEWTIPQSSSALDTEHVRRRARALMQSGTPLVAENRRDAGVDARTAASIDATYELPFLSHVCMEPLNCTVSITSAGCTVWAPTQAQGAAKATAARLTGLPETRIRIITTFLGGGNGRKIEQDYIAQAVRVALALRRPVKLTWSREEDFRNGYLRPAALVRVQASANAQGAISGWTYRNVSQSILGQRIPGFAGVDSQAVDGSIDLPYRMASRRVEWVPHDSKVRNGFWRSVGHSINCFAVESAIDELAHAAGRDPLAFRLALLASEPEAAAVLRAAADMADWTAAPVQGRAKGIAFSSCFGSLTAQVAEVSRTAQGRIRVHRVWAAIDCGVAVNPDSVAAQIEGGIIHGLSAALWGETKLTRGAAGPANFGEDAATTHRVAKLADTPDIMVRVLQSGRPMGGVGEPGVPPVAPAIANAFARLTGRRIRRLPFHRSGG